MVRSLLVLLLLLPSLAHAGNPRKLSSADAAALRGRTLTLVTHESRELALFNKRLMATPEELEQVANLAAQDWVFNPDSVALGVVVGTPTLTSITTTFGNEGILPRRFPDPAHLVADRFATRLQSRLGLLPAAAPVRAPKTRITTALVPKLDVAALAAAAPGADLVLDVETMVWQLDRTSAFSSLWYRAGPRASLVDLRTGKVLLESFCFHIEKKVVAGPPYLLALVVDDYARLKPVIDAGADDCLAQFTKAAIGAWTEPAPAPQG